MYRHNFAQIPLQLSFQKVFGESKRRNVVCKSKGEILFSPSHAWKTVRPCRLYTWDGLGVKFSRIRGRKGMFAPKTPEFLHNIQTVCVPAHAAFPLTPSPPVTQAQGLAGQKTDSILILLQPCWHEPLATASLQPDRVPESRLQSPEQLAGSASSVRHRVLRTLICLSFLLAWASTEWLPPSCSRLGTWTTIWFWLKPDRHLGRM